MYCSKVTNYVQLRHINVSYYILWFYVHVSAVVRGKHLWMRPYYISLYKRREAQGPEPERPRSIWSNW